MKNKLLFILFSVLLCIAIYHAGKDIKIESNEPKNRPQLNIKPR